MIAKYNFSKAALALGMSVGILSFSALSIGATNLGKLNIDLSQSSVSGLSSGGYMATQFQLSHADITKGAGIVGAGPYYCALGDIGLALGQCVSKTSNSINNRPFYRQYEQYLSAGLVAEQSALADDKVLLIHGKLDTTVNRTAAELLVEQYEHWLGAERTKFIGDRDFSHHMPTVAAGTACEVSETPFLGNCNFDAAGEILKFIYGELNPAVEAKSLETVDISEIVDLSGTSIADDAYMYIPTSCAQGQTCSLHVSFHGCNQSAADVGETYARDSGFNRWAESNNMVVIYPQVKKSMFMPLNPQGCWDWWGYTDENYANKEGPQIKAMYRLITALGQEQ